MKVTPPGADHLLRMNGLPAPRRLRLALLDDHDVVRRGTALHLNQDERFSIVVSHAISDSLLDSLRITRIDVAIIDLTLAEGDRSAQELIETLHAEFPRVALLAFATLTPASNLHSLMHAGIAGFVSKAEPLAELSEAIVCVSQGVCRLPPQYSPFLGRAQLSRNEREVLDLVLQGWTVSEIALSRHRSIKTVSTQKISALRKLGLRNDAEVYAMRHQMEAM